MRIGKYVYTIILDRVTKILGLLQHLHSFCSFAMLVGHYCTYKWACMRLSEKNEIVEG